ncbi:MAG: hypothetical protein AAB466_11590 [Verrucomicrobiota bacterium]
MNARLPFRLSTRLSLSVAGALFCICLPASLPGAGPAAETASMERRESVIRQLDLIHFCHTDFGFTDHPVIAREMQRRYLDIAVDAVLASQDGPEEKKFCWTAETIIAVDDWWQAASPERRTEFLQAVRTGQLDIGALPLNQAPFLNSAQWQRMLHWLPEEVWQQVQPKVAIQDDVNGFPRAGAMQLLDRGISQLFMGINEDSGGVPFKRPSAFWWKMPDGRRLFVWLNAHYGSGFDFFEPQEWRRGPVPSASDLRFRPPRTGDVLRTDEKSVRAAHQHCLEKLRWLEQSGYAHEILTLSMTSQWRMDNDPPFPALADFVAAWNRLGLKPALRLTTASATMKRLEQALGKTAPEHEGEWTDWWANGIASGPREVAASRMAKRSLAAAQSPLWGPLEANAQATVEALYKDLCLFDEHTWGSSWSVALPYSLDTIGQYNEKSALAYRPMARAEWLLSQRARTRLLSEGEGLWVANAAPASFSGWVQLPAACLREDFQSVEEAQTGAKFPLYFEPGMKAWTRPQKPEELSRENSSATFPDNMPRQIARFWVEKLNGHTIKKLRLRTETAAEPPPPPGAGPSVQHDEKGWPKSAQWPGMRRSLFLAGLGDLVAVQVKGFAPRWTIMDINGQKDERSREKMRKEKLEEVWAVAEANAAVQETAHTLIYRQELRHPRLAWVMRQLELWKREPRARVTLRFHRISSEAPEILCAAFPLPTESVLPRLSNGGLPFIPFQDQLPGTCRDYFAMDGWAQYPTADGNWLWVSRDAPLVTFGASQALARRTDPPREMNRLLAILFHNFWYTNFVGDSHGVMEFQFDLVWLDHLDAAARLQDLAESLVAEPVVMINAGGADDPLLLKHLFHP